jgi:hypothetical protein
MMESGEDRGLSNSGAFRQPMLMVASCNCRLIRFREAGSYCGMRSATVVVNCELPNNAPEMSLLTGII